MKKKDSHSIAISDFSAVFRDDASRYPADKHAFLFALMKRYELAYETENKNSLIIPHLLHEDRPKALPVFPMDESLMLRYKAEQPLPPNTISRFIVRHNEEITKKGDFLWRFGVVLEDENGSTALVREWEEERMITVSVRGNDKTTYLDKLRNTLNEIFSAYKSKKPELQYRIERFGQIPDELWLSEEIIGSHLANNRPYFDAPNNKEIPMQPVVNNYQIHAKYYFGGAQKGNIIDGHNNTVFLSDDLRQEIKSIIPHITAIANVLFDEQEEIMSELQRINTQFNKNQPKINIIGSAFQTIHGILCGVTGNIVTQPVINGIEAILKILGI